MVKTTRKMKNENRLKRRIQRLKVLGMFLVIVFICTAINYKKHKLQKQQAEYEKTIADLDDDYEEESKRTESIAELRAYVQTKQYAEEVARDKLGLVYPDEILFQAEEKK